MSVVLMFVGALDDAKMVARTKLAARITVAVKCTLSTCCSNSAQWAE